MENESSKSLSRVRTKREGIRELQRIKLQNRTNFMLFNSYCDTISRSSSKQAPRESSVREAWPHSLIFSSLSINFFSFRLCECVLLNLSTFQPPSLTLPHAVSRSLTLCNTQPWRVWQRDRQTRSDQCEVHIVNNVPNLQIVRRHVACAQHSPHSGRFRVDLLSLLRRSIDFIALKRSIGLTLEALSWSFKDAL